MKRVIAKYLIALAMILVLTSSVSAETVQQTIDAGQSSGSWISRQGVWYWQLNDKEVLKSSLLNYKDNTYFLKKDGSMSTGWETIDGSWYYFKTWGGMYQNSLVEYKGNLYYLKPDGKMATGWYLIDGVWYYFKTWGGMYKNCLVEYKGNTYCLAADGKMVTGWKQIDGSWYYFASEGDMCKNQFVTYKGYSYYLDADGKMATGWKQIDGTWYYFETWGGMRQNSFLEYCGYNYYLQNDGSMAVGWTQIEEDWYYFLPWGGGIKGTNELDITPEGSGETVTYEFSETGKLLTVKDSPVDTEDSVDAEDPDTAGGTSVELNPMTVYHMKIESLVYGEIIHVEQLGEYGFVFTLRVDETIYGTEIPEREITVYSYGSVTVPMTLDETSADSIRNELLEYSKQTCKDDYGYWFMTRFVGTEDKYVYETKALKDFKTKQMTNLTNQKFILGIYPAADLSYAEYKIVCRWMEIDSGVFCCPYVTTPLFKEGSMYHRCELYFPTREQITNVVLRAMESEEYHYGRTEIIPLCSRES